MRKPGKTFDNYEEHENDNYDEYDEEIGKLT